MKIMAMVKKLPFWRESLTQVCGRSVGAGVRTLISLAASDESAARNRTSIHQNIQKDRARERPQKVCMQPRLEKGRASLRTWLEKNVQTDRIDESASSEFLIFCSTTTASLDTLT